MAMVAPTTNVIEVEGTALSAEVSAQLESAIVVDRLTAPDTFALRFADPGRDILSRAGLEIGKQVVISTSSATSDSPVVLITGEVTSLESEYDALGARAVVRGYDKSHRLAAGRKTVTFQGVTYGDIASQIASDAGLTPDVDATEGVYDHVFQVNQSDLEFLYGLARRANRDFRVDGDTLLFKRPAASSDAPDEGDPESTEPTQLVCGDNLVEFRARMSAVGQVAKVQVRGWDPRAKEAVLGEVDVVATNAEVSMTPAQLAGKVGGQTLVVVNHGVEDQEGAERLATARAEQVGSAAFEATAVAIGDPSLKAGTAVSVAGVDPGLCGKWVISGSRHEFVKGTYRTALEFSGRQDRTLFGLVNQGAAAGGGGATSDRLPGVVIAIVDDNADPDKLGRVRLKYPWMGDDAVSFWARLAAPGAGKDYGVAWVPQVGDEVLVAFEHGDTGRPFVLGGLWNGTDTIPFDYDSDLDAGKVTYCGFTSRTGHKISFLESSSESRIHLLTATGKVSILLDDKNEEVRVETTGKLVIDARQDVEIKAGGAMTLEATGQMTIKGATVALN